MYIYFTCKVLFVNFGEKNNQKVLHIVTIEVFLIKTNMRIEDEGVLGAISTASPPTRTGLTRTDATRTAYNNANML